MARLASSNSSRAAAAFMAKKQPPTFTKGRHSSAKIGSLATAREVAMSNCSRYPYSSARAATHLASTPKVGSSSVSHVIRFCKLSSRVNFMLGSPIFRGTPGKPAPQPTSMTVFPWKSAIFRRAKQSAKCSFATACGSVMAVRFITLFFSINASPKAQSCAPCSEVNSRPKRAVSAINVSFILFLLAAGLLPVVAERRAVGTARGTRRG